MIPPLPVDVQEPRANPLVPQAESLDDGERPDVVEPDVDLDAVQAGGPEGVVDRQRESTRREAPPRRRLREPVARRRRLLGGPDDAEEVHLADDPATDLDDPRQRPIGTRLLVELTDELPVGRPSRAPRPPAAGSAPRA